jgi:hypothetical protein
MLTHVITGQFNDGTLSSIGLLSREHTNMALNAAHYFLHVWATTTTSI